MKRENILEKSVQEALERHYWTEGYTAKREVHTPVGYIDFVLYKPGEKVLVEVKEHKGIKHAIGQVYSYKKYHPDITEARIVYFCRDGKYRPIDMSYLTHDADLSGEEDKKIRFQCVHNFIELEEIYKWQKILTTSKRNQESSESSRTSLTTMTSPVQTSENISDLIKTVREELSYSRATTTITNMKSLETSVSHQEYLSNPLENLNEIEQIVNSIEW